MEYSETASALLKYFAEFVKNALNKYSSLFKTVFILL